MSETTTASILLSERGTVCVRIRAGAHQSLADARDNLAAALAACAGRRRPLLIDIRLARPLDAEVRHYYSGQVLIDGFSALALVVELSPLGYMVGNLYLRIARPGIPTRLFTDDDQAFGWLDGYIE